jgi:hypothetical protein
MGIHGIVRNVLSVEIGENGIARFVIGAHMASHCLVMVVETVMKYQSGLSHTISEHPKWFIKNVWKEHAKQHQKPHTACSRPAFGGGHAALKL